MTDITILLQRIDAGDSAAAADLLPLVYDELRKLAARELQKEPGGLTLQPTALVHEAYLRLVDGQEDVQWNHRGHFYGAAAQAMRRILVENARRRHSQKRGGDRVRISLDDVDPAAPGRHPDLLALDEALERLTATRPEIGQLVMLRYFAGLTVEQAAASLGISVRTAERNWTYAKAWLRDAISGDGSA